MSSNTNPTGDSFNRGGLIAFLFSLIFSFGFMFYVAFFHPGVNLNEVAPEGGATQIQADGGSALPADFDPRQIEKPWVSSPELIAYGAKAYATNCAVCHGPTGAGDGAAGAALNPKPRNLIEGGWKQGGGTINLYQTLVTGIPGGSMASFKHLPKVDRWAMVHWMESITKDKLGVDPAELEKFAQNAE